MNEYALCLPILAVLVVLTGCQVPSTSRDHYGDAAYSTTYLGPNGQILTDPRAPRTEAERRKVNAGRRIAPQDQGFWNGDGVTGAPTITIDLSDQTARFYKGGQLVGESPVSTGREGYRTPSGRFKVTQKNADHRSNLYGNFVDANGEVVVANVGVRKDRRPPGTRFDGAPMPYFMRVHGAVGMHGGYLPGYPASHGCIRLPMNMAEIFFANAPHGTPVAIVH
jgi:hypothetical protein